jgi:tetratricopeptide (TPR) repeat protein
LKEAEALFKKALESEPDNALAYLDLAKVNRRRAKLPLFDLKEWMTKAIELLSTAISLNPNYDRAYYNRACYRSMLNQDILAIIADLKRAIEIYPDNKTVAADDSDFESIKDSPQFEALIGH